MMHISYKWDSIIHIGEQKAQAKASVGPCFRFSALTAICGQAFYQKGKID